MKPRIRCAIYTRKSSEEGLEQAFNSLEAQREACAAFVKSQRAEGWVLDDARYDDGGLSGATLERPALQRLLAAVEAGELDRIVVYKIDRLTRSLSDFAKIVERLDLAGASFVSVTQAFNTATSMGRLTLNMLLSFAQFEREVTAERIRDKIAASKRRGLWMGGTVPLGYRADGRTLAIDPVEAPTVRTLYDLYREHGTVRAVTEHAAALALRTRRRTSPDGTAAGGQPFTRGHVYQILTNPIYAGRIRHRTDVYEGRHPALIEPAIWEEVQDRLGRNAANARGQRRRSAASVLAGKLFDETGDRLTPSHAVKKRRRFRYYVSRRLVTDPSAAHPDAWRLPADPLERGLIETIRSHLARPEAAAELVADLAARDVERLSDALRTIVERLAAPEAPRLLGDLLAEAKLGAGAVAIQIDADWMAGILGIASERLTPSSLRLEAPFQLRRRGVEARLVLGSPAPTHDLTLIRNVIRARDWYGRLTAGESPSAIAAAEGLPRQRVPLILEMALLSPDLLDAIVAGRQPPELTSQWFRTKRLPMLWADQAKAFEQA